MNSCSITLTFDFPTSLGECSIFDIGQGKPYFDHDLTLTRFHEAYKKSIKKELDTIISNSKKNSTFSVYFSGLFVELLESTDPKAIKNIKALVKSGNLEILGGTINHSLSAMYSPLCFEWEVIAHLDVMKKIFDAKPTRFFNNENLYFDGMLPMLKTLGFESAFAGVVQWYLGQNTSQRIFTSATSDDIKVLLVDAHDQSLAIASKDIQHIFLQFNLQLLMELGGLSELLKNINKKRLVVSLQSVDITEDLPKYKVKSPTMGSINGRSIASYNGEAMQRNALTQLYEMGDIIEKCQYAEFMKKHANMGRADIFLQISKSSVFNPDPFNTYSNYINMLTDMKIRLGRKS